ncbi:hypothetical protein HELRODRAFT_166252 [Helobdella robusta]|uniref:Receptor ligand binding region domain-containing protein n=1 Tax=Helobdella robusta TaxID=6412 RepID=T1EXY0_HELRO|nr:hypothetical protein HELRODRAFT_166252 [Helobdella robusta]ESN90568.1 hypothetical protein HELRODRAFT_166252 [Helobdella robusta]
MSKLYIILQSVSLLKSVIFKNFISKVHTSIDTDAMVDEKFMTIYRDIELKDNYTRVFLTPNITTTTTQHNNKDYYIFISAVVEQLIICNDTDNNISTQNVHNIKNNNITNSYNNHNYNNHNYKNHNYNSHNYKNHNYNSHSYYNHSAYFNNNNSNNNSNNSFNEISFSRTKEVTGFKEVCPNKAESFYCKLNDDSKNVLRSSDGNDDEDRDGGKDDDVILENVNNNYYGDGYYYNTLTGKKSINGPKDERSNKVGRDIWDSNNDNNNNDNNNDDDNNNNNNRLSMSHSKKTEADNSPDNKNNIHDNAISKAYPSSSNNDATSSVAHNSAAPKNEGNQKILNDYSARADQTYDDASVFKRPNVNLRAVDDNISKKAIHATPFKSSSSPSLLSSSSSSLLSSSASPSSSSSALFSQSSTHSEHSRRVKRSRNNLKSSSSSSSFSSQSTPSENSLLPSDKLPSRSSSEISPSKTSALEPSETLLAATTTTTAHTATTTTATKYIIKLIYADSKCSDRFAPIAAIDMYVNKSVQAFLGPTCEFALAPIARYAAFWNIPILSAGIGSAAKAFNDKQEVFRMLTRMTSSFRQLGKFLVESLRQEFGWKYMPILYEKYFDGVHSSLGSASDECVGCEREARNIKSRRKNNNSKKEDNRPQPCYFTMEAIFDELTTGGRSLYRAEVDSTNIYERVHNVSKRGRS